MRYTLDIIVVSIGIIGFFQLVSILTFFVYSYFLLCVCLKLVSSTVVGIYSISYTYTCLFVLKI